MTAKGDNNIYKCLVDTSVSKWLVLDQRRSSIDRVSFLHARSRAWKRDCLFVKVKILTFLCSLAFLGLSGVCEPLAGAPAMGDAVCFSIVSAGIVKTSQKSLKVNPLWKRRWRRGKIKTSFKTPADVSKKVQLSRNTLIWGLEIPPVTRCSVITALPPSARCDSTSLCRRHARPRYL